MNIRPVFEFRVPKWPFNKDRFAVQKYKWEDPHAQSPSPTVLRKTVGVGGITVGLTYDRRGR